MPRTPIRSAPAGPVRVVGVDPGLASVGWGVVDLSGSRILHVAHGCLRTEAGLPLAERLASVRDGLREVLEGFRPVEGAMEALFFSKNVTSAIKVAEAKGVIRLLFLDSGVPLAEYGPAAIKQAAAGAGRADKAEVQAFLKLVLGLDDFPKPDHAADALAVAVCHCHSRGLAGAIASASSARV